MKRRVLSEFRLDKIAAVDRPCQEGALVTIMKSENPELLARIEKLSKQLEERERIVKVWSEVARRAAILARRAKAHYQRNQKRYATAGKVAAFAAGFALTDSALRQNAGHAKRRSLNAQQGLRAAQAKYAVPVSRSPTSYGHQGFVMR